MIFISTKDNGLRHRVSGFQITAHLVGHLSDAVFYDDVVIVVGIVVDTVFYHVAVDVALSLGGSPFVTDIRCDIDHLEGR